MSDGCDICLRSEEDGLEIHCECQECQDDADESRKESQVRLLKKILRRLPNCEPACAPARRFVKGLLADLKKPAGG